MTPEQITQLLGILTNVPAQALLGIGLYILWRSFSSLVERTFALIEKWSALAMKIVENANQTKSPLLLPAKISESTGSPPAPG